MVDIFFLGTRYIIVRYEHRREDFSVMDVSQTTKRTLPEPDVSNPTNFTVCFYTVTNIPLLLLHQSF